MSKTRIIAAAAASLLCCLTLAAGAAFAHAMLVRAVPAVGGKVASSPAEIRISLSEAIEPRFSGIEIRA